MRPRFRRALEARQFRQRDIHAEGRRGAPIGPHASQEIVIERARLHEIEKEQPGAFKDEQETSERLRRR